MYIPIKKRQFKSISDAWHTCLNRLQDNEYATNLHLIVNEWSGILKSVLKKYNVDFQLVTSYRHSAM